MPHITRELLRRRAEHNEGILSTLEEVSLHQEELESINEVLAMTCRKIKILYLQNNIIPKMENLHHMKDLEYLNLALNNITKIEGLDSCEFLHKLDLTVNFIDLDTLKESIEHLQSRERLQDLYLMGNPAQVNWPDFNDYVIAKLPQLKTLDGTEITKSMQIRARQRLQALEEELQVLAIQARRKKAEKARERAARGESAAEDDMTENTPEDRVKIYQELAQQKREKEERQRANQPKERDYDAEQSETVASVRAKEAEVPETEVRQKNEGGWDFFWDEESRPGHLLLTVHVPRHLDSSLIDVDIHPTYVSIVIKAKLLRLRLPAEVRVAESKCQRAKTTGHLLVVMPKVDAAAPAVTVKVDPKAQKQQEKDAARQREAAQRTRRKEKGGAGAGGLSLHDLMMQEATAASQSQGNSLRDEDVGHGTTQQLTAIVKSKERADSAGAESTVFTVQQQSQQTATRVLVTEVEEAMAAMTALD